MPRKRGGRRGNRKKKGFNSKRELIIKEDGQEYAQCIKLLGSGRMSVHCFDGKNRLAKIRGKFKRRVWVNIGDVVLVQKREMNIEDDKCDVIHVYYYDEVKKLKNFGELPSDLEVTEKKNDEKVNLNVVFGDEEEDKEVEEVKKSVRQNLNDFMPSNSSDEEYEVEDKKSKKKNETKIVNDEVKTKKKVLTPVQSESDSESEKEVDELDDI